MAKIEIVGSIGTIKKIFVIGFLVLLFVTVTDKILVPSTYINDFGGAVSWLFVFLLKSFFFGLIIIIIALVTEKFIR